jgi:hypothetical protein
MTTEPTYTDAQIEYVASHLQATDNCLPSVKDCTTAADMLRSLLSERQAAMQGQGGDIWRCFYCDEVFTDREAAALHFGTQLSHNAACKIDIAEYRRMEAKSELYRDEDAAIHREMRGMENEHQRALRRAEEDGYAKGIAALQPPQPVRSVSDEDVELACCKYYNCGHPVYPPVFEGMRAALEHFAAIAQEKQS